MKTRKPSPTYCIGMDSEKALQNAEVNHIIAHVQMTVEFSPSISVCVEEENER